jgi:AbrB family looped-hinge helix DNA binding protein
MSTLQSKLTAQGQISVPAEVRRELGVGPGSVLIWEPRNGEFIVRRAGKNSSADVHAALFGDEARTRREATDAKAGIRKYIRRRHARG